METLLLLGFALGIKHATDADHLAAVSALVRPPSQGSSVFSNALTGALWGAGHLLSIALAGSILIVWRVKLPATVVAALELLVACVLIWLGVRTLHEVFRYRVHFHSHKHGGDSHAHVHFHAATHPHDRHAHDAHLPSPSATGRGRAGAFFVGTLHGLAGTAGLTLLVLATIPSRSIALMYLLLFSVGALIGMTLFSATLGALLRGGPRWLTLARLIAGAANAIIGILLMQRTILAL